MSFKIKLFTFSKKINSTAQPTGGTEYDCLIKSPSSIMNPVVELNVNPMAFNYAYISEFSRYYFINDIRFDKGLWICALNIDVLATYKTTIGSSSTYVLRAANAQNEYLIDNAFPMTGAQTCQKVNIEAQGTATFNTGYYFVTVTGNQQANGKTVYQLTPALFSNLLSSLFTTADGYQWGDLTQGVINALMNPLEYISSVIWSPVGFTTTGSQRLYCGLWDSGLTCDTVSGVGVIKGYTITLPKHPQAASYGKYCNMEPFSQYSLDLGYTGLIPLDTTRLVDVSSIYISVALDAITGMARIKGENILNGNNILFDIKTQYGVPIPMSQVSTNIGGVLSNAIETVADLAVGDYANAALDATALLGSVAKAATGSSTTKGTMGSIISHSFDYNLYARFFTIADRNPTDMGKPLCTSRTPSTLGGYMKCANAHVAISGTSAEASMINAYMEAGFYYE